MDDKEHPSVGTLIAEVAMPMIFGTVVAMLFLPAVMPVLLFVILIIVALGSAPVFILFVVRSLNRRDDSRHHNRPPDAP